ncbi:DUF6941 family protein [Modestobacter marinus]|uniref:DUF6941 family protein n=1 Tax=Modestobacter marinus TaxID=477641 RepID=UPI001C94CD54|nr:hypothetical protein [Modestobacter marinus]
MASLDFAFLSESARVDLGNQLSALGIGFTHISPSELPMATPVTVAGLVWMTEEDEGSAELEVTILGAEDSYEVSLEQRLFVPEGEPDLEGRQAAAFVAPITLPLTTPGIYRVNIHLNGTLTRSLSFEVMRPWSTGSGDES